MEKQITLATLEQATAQEVFDQVARHMLTQNAKSYSDSDSTCYYRDPEGRKCAAGCLIADDEYTGWDGLEGASWRTLSGRGRVPLTHMDLIQALQNIHDFREVREWSEELTNLAETHGLSPTVIEEFRA